jgi:hypothetical protein
MEEGKRIYRIYRLDEQGRVTAPPVELYCSNDEEAIERAKQLLDEVDLEIWNLARFVRRLKHRE